MEMTHITCVHYTCRARGQQLGDIRINSCSSDAKTIRGRRELSHTTSQFMCRPDQCQQARRR
ncbi:hypothetical protein BS17DRAFT_783476 [Gyrodon lividus]|nr:hypothetical protein BS17DRAFT_783476 [Gyrodon lividus]